MNKLIEIIRFEGKHYFVVNDLDGRKAIETLATKLTSLERKIIDHPKGTIDINKDGLISISLMPDELVDKINELSRA